MPEAQRATRLDPVKKVLTARPVEYGRTVESVSLDIWARTTGGRRLAPLGRRWVHSQAVGQRAAEVGQALTLGSSDRDMLVAAAVRPLSARIRHEAESEPGYPGYARRVTISRVASPPGGSSRRSR